MITEKVYLGHDNTFSLTVKQGEVAVDLLAASVSRMVLNFDTTQIDSDVEGEGAGQPFDWATAGATGIVAFDLGGLSPALNVGQHLCTLTIFDPAHSSGQVWDEQFYLVVEEQVVT